MKKQVFKPYSKSQLSLPVELEVFIPDNHIVRIVDQVIDSIDISKLLEQRFKRLSSEDASQGNYLCLHSRDLLW